MASSTRRKASPRPRQDRGAAEGIDFQAITEGTLDVIVHCGDDGTATYVSPSIQSLLGRTPEEMIGRQYHIEDVFPEDLPSVMQAWKSHQAGQVDGRATFRMRHKNGSAVWVEGSGRMLKDAATGKITLVIVLRDISERKALEAQLTLLALTNAVPPAGVTKADRTGERSLEGPRERPRAPRNVN